MATRSPPRARNRTYRVHFLGHSHLHLPQPLLGCLALRGHTGNAVLEHGLLLCHVLDVGGGQLLVLEADLKALDLRLELGTLVLYTQTTPLHVTR